MHNQHVKIITMSNVKINAQSTYQNHNNVKINAQPTCQNHNNVKINAQSKVKHKLDLYSPIPRLIINIGFLSEHCSKTYTYIYYIYI